MTDSLYIVLTTLTNEDKGYQFSEWSEPLDDLYLDDDDKPMTGRIFRQAQREYGRCMSKVYVDTDHGAEPVGWFFVSRQQYEDTSETYLRGAWVTIAKGGDK